MPLRDRTSPAATLRDVIASLAEGGRSNLKKMMIYKFIFMLIFLCAALERITSTFKNRNSDGDIRYKWTTYLLMCSYSFCVLVALFEFAGKGYVNYGISITGAIVAGTGIFLRKASIKALGKFWSFHIIATDRQPAVKIGPYKFLRHPYYTAVMLELIGVSLFFNAFLSLWLVFLFHFPILLLRVFLEDKVLLCRGT